jgi:excinuclease ABC subunit C
LKYPATNIKIDYLKSLISFIPEDPGIYQFFDISNTIIYIGKAKNLKKRIISYFVRNQKHKKTALLVRNISEIRYIILESEEDALLLENNLIKKYQPRYNIRLKDDKTFPWICIKNEEFPRVFKTRKFMKDGSKYFGPFTSGIVLDTFLALFKSTYKLRNCNYILSKQNISSQKYKVCLEYYIGNCLGPCEGFISHDEYQQNINEIIEILKGNVSGIIKRLKGEMNDFSSRNNFEDAQRIKLKFEQLEKYQRRSTVVSSKIENVDVFSIIEDQTHAYINYLKIIKGAIIQTHTLEIKKCLEEGKEDLLTTAIIEIRQKFYSNSKEIIVPFRIKAKFKDLKFVVPQKGDKKHLLNLSTRNAQSYKMDKERQLEYCNSMQRTERLLETIKTDLQLKELPKRMECFDNSNLMGKNPVASCVVFLNAIPAKKEYRHFNIKTVIGANDYASMEEVIYRRYSRQIMEGNLLPQLIIIDGGKGQLNAAVSALEKLGLKGKITIIGIAKKLEELFFPNDNIPIYLNKNSETLKIIQKMRNEAHRFGISFHRQKRSNSFINSELENIEGVGQQTINKLFKRFKSIIKIKELSLEEIASEIGNSKAKLVKEFFEKELPRN